MARSAMQLQEEENYYFHLNYLYIEKLPNEHINLTMQEAAERQDLMISSQNQGI